MPDTSCSVADCIKPAKSKGLCMTHYQRLRRTGTTDEPERAASCLIDGCDLPARTREMCSKHYQESRRREHRAANPFKKYQPCIDPEPDGSQCTRPVMGRERCRRHYDAYMKIEGPKIRQAKINRRRARSCVNLRVRMLLDTRRDWRSANCVCHHDQYYCDELELDLPRPPAAKRATVSEMRKMHMLAGRVRRRLRAGG